MGFVSRHLSLVSCRCTVFHFHPHAVNAPPKTCQHIPRSLPFPSLSLCTAFQRLPLLAPSLKVCFLLTLSYKRDAASLPRVACKLPNCRRPSPTPSTVHVGCVGFIFACLLACLPLLASLLCNSGIFAETLPPLLCRATCYSAISNLSPDVLAHSPFLFLLSNRFGKTHEGSCVCFIIIIIIPLLVL